MIIKEGRFGAYVTNGEINATLRRGDDIETITSERAAELLAEKRAKGPAPKKRAAKRSQAAAAATTSSSKPTAKRVPAKKVRAKTG
jgi:DNA topoisomerase-1